MTDFTRNNEIVVCDAMAYLSGFGDGSADAIICDPPYLTTDLAFDKAKIDWGALITECLRVVKPSGAVVMFAAMRTAVAMIGAAPKYYRYEWVWNKTRPSGFASSKIMPMRSHEYALVFGKTGVNYYPIMREGESYTRYYYPQDKSKHYSNTSNKKVFAESNGDKSPISVLSFANPNHNTEHPTQKPLDLMAYLVRTYTRPDELVIDCFAGSGSTLVAARNTGRRYAGCDLSVDYVNIARKRLAEPFTPEMFPEAAPVEPEATQGDLFAAWDSV